MIANRLAVMPKVRNSIYEYCCQFISLMTEAFISPAKHQWAEKLSLLYHAATIHIICLLDFNSLPNVAKVINTMQIELDDLYFMFPLCTITYLFAKWLPQKSKSTYYYQ